MPNRTVSITTAPTAKRPGGKDFKGMARAVRDIKREEAAERAAAHAKALAARLAVVAETAALLAADVKTKTDKAMADFKCHTRTNNKK